MLPRHDRKKLMNDANPRVLVTVLLSLLPVGLTCSEVRGAPPGLSSNMPSYQTQVLLIKNALIALNQANLTGNYTVVRDLCSPKLRKRQKAADFALAFHKTHDRNRDMSFVMDMNPNPTQQPVFSTDGRMRLIGYFATQPLELHYDLVFLKTVQGDWWIDGIVLQTGPARPPVPPAPQIQIGKRYSGDSSY